MPRPKDKPRVQESEVEPVDASLRTIAEIFRRVMAQSPAGTTSRLHDRSRK